MGRPKAEVMAARALDVNPDCRVHPIVGRYDRGDSERFWGRYDLVADCIDLVSCKVDLICQALERGIPIVSALGTGNKLDPSLLEVTDLAKTRGCPLARVMRRSVPGSVPWVPPAAGVLLGGAAVMELIGGLIPEKEENKEERP